MADLQALQEGGVDGILISNEFSLPYQRHMNFVTPAAMAYVVGCLRGSLRVPFGVDCISDGAATLELAAAVKRELKPPASGFFTASPNSLLQGVLVGDRLELRCSNTFAAQTIDKPEILEVVSRKAGAQLGRPIRAVVVDTTASHQNNPRMEQLLAFGREHSDVVRIKNY